MTEAVCLLVCLRVARVWSVWGPGTLQTSTIVVSQMKGKEHRILKQTSGTRQEEAKYGKTG